MLQCIYDTTELNKEGFGCMGFFKKRVSVEEAVDAINQAIIDDIRDTWKGFYSSLRERHENFIIDDEDYAEYEIFLACTALELQSIYNIFPKSIADRIYRIVFDTVNTEENGEYAINKLLNYEKNFKKAIIEVDNPLTPITGILVQSILGERIKDFRMNNSDFISPLLIIEVMTYLTQMVGRWKKISNVYKIV